MHYLWGKDEGVICVGWKKGSAINNTQNNIKWGNSWWWSVRDIRHRSRELVQNAWEQTGCRYMEACWAPRPLLHGPTLFLTKIRTHQRHFLWNPGLSSQLCWKEPRAAGPCCSFQCRTPMKCWALMGFGHAGWGGQAPAVSLSSATGYPGVAGQEYSNNSLLKKKKSKKIEKKQQKTKPTKNQQTNNNKTKT